MGSKLREEGYREHFLRYVDREYPNYREGLRYLADLREVQGYVTQEDICWTAKMVNLGSNNFLDRKTLAARVNATNPVWLWYILDSLWPGCKLRTQLYLTSVPQDQTHVEVEVCQTRLVPKKANWATRIYSWSPDWLRPIVARILRLSLVPMLVVRTYIVPVRTMYVRHVKQGRWFKVTAAYSLLANAIYLQSVEEVRDCQSEE